MKRWHIKISGYAPQENTVEDVTDPNNFQWGSARYSERARIDEVDVTEFTTDLKWSNALTSPYEQGAVSLVVPFAEARDLVGLGSVEGLVFRPHASGWLTILEDVSGTLRTRFYGPITRVSSGVQVDAKTGARNTLRLSVAATSWLSVLSRGFKVAKSDSLNVAGSLISFAQWSSIMDAVIQAANTSLPRAFEKAWERLGALQSLPNGEFLSDYAYVTSGPIKVQGRNLSQIQMPPLKGTLWDVLTATFQASDLIELYPKWVQAERESQASLVYRLRPPSLSVLAVNEEGRSLYLDDKYGTLRDISFVPEDYVDEPIELLDVERFSADYDGTQRVNYIEVTSPYTGASTLAGVPSDPILDEYDIQRYGLHEYTTEYPYIRDEGTIREQVNNLTGYAALLHAEAHRYGSGTIETRYTPDVADHGDWVRWYSYGPDSVPLEGYVTSVTHTVKVAQTGAVSASSSWTVERVSTYQRST
jgi:hypothetical protein